MEKATQAPGDGLTSSLINAIRALGEHGYVLIKELPGHDCVYVHESFLKHLEAVCGQHAGLLQQGLLGMAEVVIRRVDSEFQW